MHTKVMKDVVVSGEEHKAYKRSDPECRAQHTKAKTTKTSSSANLLPIVWEPSEVDENTMTEAMTMFIDEKYLNTRILLIKKI